LHKAALALVHSTAEYCAPIWCRSTCLVDKLIHDALQLVTWMPSPYPINNHFVLEGIIPIELCQKRAALSLAHCAMDPDTFSMIDSCSHQLHNSENSNRGA